MTTIAAGQIWIFSVRCAPTGQQDFVRRAVVGPAQASTVEDALRLAQVPGDVCSEIRASQVVRDFVNGKSGHQSAGHLVPSPRSALSEWLVCIGPVHEVLDR